MYCEGEGAKHKPVEGKRLIERSIQELIDDSGNDDYFKQIECYRIGIVYFLGSTNADKRPTKADLQKAMEYLSKCAARCDDSYQSDRELASQANKAYDEAKRQLS